MRLPLLSSLLSLGLAQDPAAYLDLLRDYVTPVSGLYGNVSSACQSASDRYLGDLGSLAVGGPARPSSLLKLDATSPFPPPGLLSDSHIIHFPGSFSGCLAIRDGLGLDGRSEVGERDPDLDGKYCLLTLVGYETYKGVSGGGAERKGYAHMED